MILFDLKNIDKNTHTNVSPTLLWEYDINLFDYHKMRNLVVQRVVERGWPDDFYAMLNIYGLEGVEEALKEIPYLNERDMYFVHNIFEIPLEDLLCYKNRQFLHQHWNS